ncbi:MAG: type II secretion system GspH family protein [Candidatus Omnitrophica bacterium]|nr:type II secretion system GspH family protein [Candidatus Omnitrophota bacterium]
MAQFFLRKKMFNTGFTLTELLIVVVILGILATLALPMLVKTIEKAKVGEATSNLNLIRTGQKIYFLEYSTFWPDITQLNIENPNEASSRYFEYTSSSAGDSLSSDFTATATRGGGGAADASSPYQGVVYYISKDGQITSSDGKFMPQR